MRADFIFVKCVQLVRLLTRLLLLLRYVFTFIPDFVWPCLRKRGKLVKVLTKSRTSCSLLPWITALFCYALRLFVVLFWFFSGLSKILIRLKRKRNIILVHLRLLDLGVWSIDSWSGLKTCFLWSRGTVTRPQITSWMSFLFVFSVRCFSSHLSHRF